MRPQALYNSLWQLSVYRRSLTNHCSVSYTSPSQQPRASDTSKASSTGSAQRASTKLFADAQREEAESKQHPETTSNRSSQLPFLERQHENWTGDERIQDSVLRMLVDKYKPLRTGSIQSADQKLTRAPPLSLTHPIVRIVPLKPSTGSWTNEALLPSTPGHRPWQTQFKAPSHDVSSIKLAQMPPPISARPSGVLIHERAQKLEKENKKRTQHAGRLTQARESTLDYRLGIREARGTSRLPNPVSIKGWATLIEDKIEKARKAGLFNSVKGRGQPLVQSMDGRNPFIPREEFLMNRIVQRNGAAPPWVEIQTELDSTLNTFRELLRQSWIRRVIRGLSMEHPADIIHNLTLNDIKSFRDSEWVNREKAHHEIAIAELNSHVRKYNGVAPYAVRRAYYTREVEIQRLYDDCAEDILRAIADRVQETRLFSDRSSSQGGDSDPTIGSVNPGEKLSLLRWFRRLFRSWCS